MKKIFLLLLITICACVTSAQLTITAGAQLAVTGNLQLTLQNSNLINNGFFLAGEGNVIFAGDANAAIAGDQPVIFNDLELNKANKQSVQLEKNIFITNRLLFTAGFLNLNGSSINLGFTGRIDGEQENANVTGINGGEVMINTSLDFPVNANPGNLGLFITAGQHLGNITIRRGHQSQVTGTGNSILRYYNIIPADNIDINATLRFTYLNTELNGFDESALVLAASKNNIDWAALGFNSRDTATNFVEKTGVNLLGRFTLSVVGGALPVRFTEVKTKCQGDKVLVSWKTAQEQNSHHFKIEKSSDGLRWGITGSIPAAGNSTDEILYSFADNNSGSNDFYRIGEVDADGRIQYSSVVSSSCTINEFFSVWPNPASDKLYVRITATNNAAADVKVFDNKGALIKSKQFTLLRGSNRLELDMVLLAPGVYQVMAIWNSGQSVRRTRIIKQ